MIEFYLNQEDKEGILSGLDTNGLSCNDKSTCLEYRIVVDAGVVIVVSRECLLPLIGSCVLCSSISDIIISDCVKSCMYGVRRRSYDGGLFRFVEMG